jgi:uncharacterized protein YPO0396
MLTIFDTETRESGFRLKYLELLNWGTFDKKIWRICPDGKSSLLTGGNGSGKTTIADAILTLLVPPMKRYYNQSSGTDQKRDRTEDTYVKGAFKTVQQEGELSPKRQYLRTSDCFSVILGVFFNQDMNDTLTLAQVRWFAGHQLKRWFIISPEPLNIQAHFNLTDSEGKWKKQMAESCRAEFFSSFSQYSHRFSKLFGLKSEKALTLFSQTVGIKVLGNLNEFIRTHMLAEHDTEQDFTKLRANYDNLLSSHKAIEKAKSQLELLKPIMESGDLFERLSGELGQLESAKEAVPAYFAGEKNKYLSQAVEENKSKLEGVREHIETIKEKLAELSSEKEELAVALRTDEVSEQIRYIAKEIENLTKEKNVRQKNAEDYNRIAVSLNLPPDPDESLFRQTITEIGRQKARHEEESESLIRKQSGLENEIKSAERDFYEICQDLESLRQRKSNIPRKNLSIRRRIAESLNIRESEIPFAGELIRVRESEQIWESAIERLMRNFGLNLLVPENLYRAFTQYVNYTQLYGRIVYHRVPEKTAPDMAAPPDPRSLIKKLEIQSDTRFYHWLERYILRAFNYICTEDLKEFERLEKALTPNALVKNRGRHEKDDRPNMLDKANYIFGWDNTEKIRAIETQAKALDSRLQQLKQSVSETVEKRKTLDRKKADMTELSRYDKFSLLDWKPLAAGIEELKSKQQKLLGSSDKIRELETQLRQVKKGIAEKEKERETLSRDQFSLEESIRRYTEEFNANLRLLEAYDHVELEPLFELLIPYIKNTGKLIRLDTIDAVKQAVSQAMDADLKNRGEEASRVEKDIIRKMGYFKHGNEAILEKYPDWLSETVNLREDAAYLPEYRAVYDRIQTEDLPRHKHRFKEFLNEQVVLDIASFKSSLENYAAEIKENIKEINQSLKEIDYNSNPATYIRLAEKDENDVRIRDFKQMLRESMPDPAKLVRGDEQELEFSFNRIKDLIEKLTAESEWRKYVTDVRNWLRFAAEERYREDGAQKQYYEDSQSLSGGEKAKLAYTILGSAIAYQFGIRTRDFNLKSFRFVVVDEAFSKVDPENSVYAMELFKKLNLQLMLVTPLDKIHLAEKYIHTVHYVQNKYQRDSEVYDMSITEYYRRKEFFKQEAALHLAGNEN